MKEWGGVEWDTDDGQSDGLASLWVGCCRSTGHSQRGSWRVRRDGDGDGTWGGVGRGAVFVRGGRMTYPALEAVPGHVDSPDHNGLSEESTRPWRLLLSGT